MNLKEIKKEAQKILDEKEKQRLVSKYMDLLEIKKQTEKQLKKINKSISKFEIDPELFCDKTENLW